MFPSRASRIATLVLLLLCARLAMAHPMGNFSVNHYSKITPEKDRVRVQYIVDLAEIPAFQELQQGGISADAKDPAVLRFVAARGAEFGRGLSLSLNGTALPLRLKSDTVVFPPGAGGLPTLKMGFVYEAIYPAGAGHADARLRYADANYAGHTGWKEIVAVAGTGAELLRSTVPTTSRSNALSDYPTDLLSSPPQDLEASLEVALPGPSPVTAAVPLVAIPAGRQAQAVPHPSVRSSVPTQLPATTAQTAALVPLQANRQTTPRSRFTELITEQHLSLWFLLTAALIAMGLGGLHALEPGHGKTIVAAYLVGSRGTARHAMMLGLIVTATHTAAVFALGALTLYASRYIVPEQLYPWLGVLSGLVIAVLGGSMLLRRLTGTATDHNHGANGIGSHWFARKRAETGDAPQIGLSTPVKPVSLTQLVTLGITGGIVPCPAALIVLLSAVALHRVSLGFFLIVAFSMGLAAVLIAFGMMMVYARRFMTHLQLDGPLTKRWLPSASAAFIMILGGAVAWQGFAATPLHLHLVSTGRLAQLLFVAGLGLLLGMRHSTDADHIVAISTIVGKQRSVRGAALIGSVWGIGHTITIFIVGSLIILFNVEIPVRLGLSMEFSVAVMLVVLGVSNLTGLTQRVTNRFTTVHTEASVSPSQTSFRESALKRNVRRFGVYQMVRPLVIGLVHGLAGSAAVALLVLSTIHDPVWATFYLLIFGAGTMLGMMCMTAAIAVPLTYMGGRMTKTTHYLNFASGVASLCFGSFLVYQLGFLGGLFGSHPQWTPR